MSLERAPRLVTPNETANRRMSRVWWSGLTASQRAAIEREIPCQFFLGAGLHGERQLHAELTRIGVALPAAA